MPHIKILLFTLFVASNLSADDLKREHKGSLVIVGGGKMPDSIRNHFLELAGKDKAKLVVIPTASQDADKPNAEEIFLKQWKDLKITSVTLLHTRDRKKADDMAFIQPLSQATAVWFSGGDQNRILQSYAGTAVENELRELLKRNGVIGGTSAGAAIQSEWMIEGGNPEAKIGKGFGWLTGCVVDQHFLKRNRIDRLLGVLEKHPDQIGIGIDESTAAIVQNQKLTVLGESYVLILRKTTKGLSIQSLKSGDSTPLNK